MYFLEDKKNKILFGTTAKAGCQHIRVLYKFFVLNNNNAIHERRFKGIRKISLPKNYKKYLIIIFFRNPYERIVSSFKEKYLVKNGMKFKNTNYLDIIFADFINDLEKNKFKNIDKPHFQVQVESENNTLINNKLLEHNNIKFFDIKNIDYTFLENIYKKNITDEVKNFKGNHTYKLKLKTNELFNDYVYDKPYNKYINYKLLDCYFYNKKIKKQVYNFYKEDFDFAEIFGYNYKRELLIEKTTAFPEKHR